MAKTYIIVASLADNRVVAIASSSVVTRDNLAEVAKAVGDGWYSSSREYPPSAYDIISARAESLKSVIETLPGLQGWHSVPITPLGVPS